MPRAGNAPSKPAPPAAQRGKSNNKAAVTTARAGEAGSSRLSERKEVCPLCIEELDATDLSFLPCPCGYRICLFCYEQVKLQCHSKCPGCRREYGSVTETEDSKEDTFDEYTPEDFASTATSSAAAEGGRAVAAAHVAEASSGARAAAAAAAAATGRPPPGPSLAPAQAAAQQQAQQQQARRASAVDASTSAKRSNSVMDDAQGGGLPSASTWGSTPRQEPQQQQPQQQQQQQSFASHSPAPPSAPAPASAAMDQSAWPSLADSSAAQAQAALRQRQEADSAAASAASMRRSASAASNTMGERFGSSSSLDQMADTHHAHATPAAAAAAAAAALPAPAVAEHLPPPPQQPQQQQQQYYQYSSQYPAAAPGPQASTSYAHTNGALAPRAVGLTLLEQQQQQQQAAIGHATAQVSTTVQGMRRAITVPLSAGPAPEVYAEAPALVASMQQSVSNGTLHSRDAAAQLLTLLRHKEASKAQVLLAAGKAPPGFTSPQFGIAAAAPRSFLFSSSLNNQDNPVVPGPPVGRYNPISPPPFSNGGAAPGQQQQQPQYPQDRALAVGGERGGGGGGGMLSMAPPSTSAALNGGGYGVLGSSGYAWPAGSSPLQPLGLSAPGQASTSSLGGGGGYSLWNTHGLPGIDYGGSPLQSLWQASAAGGAPAVSTSYGSNNSLGGSGVRPGYDPQVSFPGGAAKLPPPGFGGEAGGGQRPQYTPMQQQPIGTRYNPLGAAGVSSSGLAPPPGLPSYRPHLGAGGS